MCDTCRSAESAARQTPIGSECSSPADLRRQSTSPRHAAPPQSSLVVNSILVGGCLSGLRLGKRCSCSVPLPPSHGTRLPVGRCAPLLRHRPTAATSLCDDLGHLLAVARNVPQSATVPLLLLHRLFGTACRRTYGHPHHCSCYDVSSRLSFFGVLWAQDTPRDDLAVT